MRYVMFFVLVCFDLFSGYAMIRRPSEVTTIKLNPDNPTPEALKYAWPYIVNYIMQNGKIESFSALCLQKIGDYACAQSLAAGVKEHILCQDLLYLIYFAHKYFYISIDLKATLVFFYSIEFQKKFELFVRRFRVGILKNKNFFKEAIIFFRKIDGVLRYNSRFLEDKKILDFTLNYYAASLAIDNFKGSSEVNEILIRLFKLNKDVAFLEKLDFIFFSSYHLWHKKIDICSFFEIGRSYINVQQWEMAEKIYNKAIGLFNQRDLDSENLLALMKIHEQLGRVYVCNQKYVPAKSALETVLVIDAVKNFHHTCDLFNTYLALGEACFWLKEYASAKACFEKALKTNPSINVEKLENFYAYLGCSCFYLKQSDKAKAFLYKALVLDMKKFEITAIELLDVYLSLAKAYIVYEEYKRAEEAHDKVLAIYKSYSGINAQILRIMFEILSKYAVKPKSLTLQDMRSACCKSINDLFNSQTSIDVLHIPNKI